MLLDAIRAALADLDRYAATLDATRLQHDRDAQNMVLHAMYSAVQAAIDLAYHVVADEGLPIPPTYRAGFESLREAGWLADDLAGRLAGWAGLRDIIAHGYLKIDFNRIHAALHERNDLRDFVATMATRLAA